MSAAGRAATRRIPNPRMARRSCIDLAEGSKGTRLRGRIEHNGKVRAFNCQNQLIGSFNTRIEAVRARDLAHQADAILIRANCDTTTGEKQDRQYRRNKRAESKRVARLLRARSKKLGKFGAASPVRSISAGRLLEGAEPKVVTPPAPGDT